MKTIIHGGKAYRTSIAYRCPKRRKQSVERCASSKGSVAKAAIRFNVNPKTIIKWRKREDTKDLPMGPKEIKSTVLSAAEEKAIVAFRKL